MKKISFYENKQSIMMRKIEFLETQLSQASRRQQNLMDLNTQLRKSLNELSNDKSQIISIINSERDSDLQPQLRQKTKEIQSLKTKLSENSFLNQEYQKQLGRMQNNMKQHIQSLQLAHQRQKKHLQNKIQYLEMVIKKYQTQQVEQEEGGLKNQTKDIKKRPSNKREIDTSEIELQSIIKTMDRDRRDRDRRDTTFTLQDIQNVSFNRVPTQSDFSNSKSKTKLGMTRSRSGISEARSVISSLYCQLCKQNYSPNQYYKHLAQHGQKGRLIQQKIQIERKLEQKGKKKKLQNQLENIMISLKDRQKKNCLSARPLIR